VKAPDRIDISLPRLVVGAFVQVIVRAIMLFIHCYNTG